MNPPGQRDAPGHGLGLGCPSRIWFHSGKSDNEWLMMLGRQFV
jgi:hypothetical protein